MTAMESVSEREFVAPHGRKWPWTSFVGKKRESYDKQKAALRHRRLRNAYRFFRMGVVAWRSTGSISADDRVRLEDRFRHAWRVEYRRRFIHRRLDLLLQLGMLLSYLVFFAVLPIALPEKYRAGDYVDTFALAFVGPCLVLITGYLLVYPIAKYLDGRWAIAEAVRDIGSNAAILLVCAPILYLSAQSSREPLFVVFLGLMAWGAVFAAVFGVAWVALSVATNLVRRRDPDALLAATLFGAVRSLEFGPDRWPEPEFRAGIARELGAASAIARSFLFTKFDAADLETRLWQRRQANRIADGLAQKQRWLVTPKPDTYDFLLGALSRCLVAVLGGNWDELARSDALETVEAEDAASRLGVSRGRRALVMLLRGLQTIAVAALPAAALWMARSRDLLAHVDARMLDYVEIGVFVWAVLILAFMLDPHLKEKISSAKEVISLMNPLSKRGD
jgi:hypothetical protein